MKQLSLTLPKTLLDKAEYYAKTHGFRNIQELAAEALREKMFNDEFDEDFTEKEIELIDKLIEASLSKGKVVSEQELRKALA